MKICRRRRLILLFHLKFRRSLVSMLSQIAETPTIHISSSKFTIGSDQSCSHVLQGRRSRRDEVEDNEVEADGDYVEYAFEDDF
ncbi:hypothetical protein L195_g043318 [Trifolium pratense]|uniref:Uncharacterized protein n=1 Tax=Trifolium pratense TaxID=57577 RepID=A0A2K3M8W1_TRIPR|nr:hypothetical protein L195_g043318 [Trifolium pratense]